MKHVTLPIVILVSFVSYAGCAKPCFYQAGKSVEQCKRDLRQCIDQAQGQRKSQSDEQTRSCMQAKGYECLDANKVSQDTKRIMVTSPFGTYWALDGLKGTPAGNTAASQAKPAENDRQAPAARQIGYRARLDAAGKYVITPVYEQEQKEERNSSRLANSGK